MHKNMKGTMPPIFSWHSPIGYNNGLPILGSCGHSDR